MSSRPTVFVVTWGFVWVWLWVGASYAIARIKCPLCWASTWLGWCQLFVGVMLDTDGGGEGFLRVFVVFVYLIRVFSGLLPGWPQPEC